MKGGPNESQPNEETKSPSRRRGRRDGQGSGADQQNKRTEDSKSPDARRKGPRKEASK